MSEKRHKKRGKKKRTVTSEQTIILEDIKHSAHLTEDQDSGAFLFHRVEKFVQNDHLATVFNEMDICRIRWTGFLGLHELLKISQVLDTHCAVE